jgi:hypothetical protein
MSFKSEALALAFGALFILLTFGDAHLSRSVGNLDVIFGGGFWPWLDVVYPLASIAVFLLYGWVKGGLRIGVLTVAVFVSYLLALAFVSLDDIAVVLHLSLGLTKAYWVVVEWLYPLYSIVAFFIFGRANQPEKTGD